MLAFEGDNESQRASGVGQNVESLLDRFESAWEQGESPAIADFLPQVESQRKLAVVELAHIDLERRIGRGEPIRVEKYLAEFAELASDPAAAVALIGAEFKLRRTHDASLSPEEFFRRFPQHRDRLMADGPVGMRGGDQQKFSAIQARSSAGRLDALCDRFESALKAGQQPRIEEFVAAIPSSVAEQGVRELLGIELSYHRRSGHDVSLDDCRRRLPQYSAVVEDVFRDLANRFPRLGDYELLDVIGSGGMGTVYCARHLRLGKLVALKVLRAGLEEGRLLLERFKQEMHLIGRLNHPNIVTALDAREENGTLFLVMELVDGASVDRLSAAGPLRIADACEIARQVALGLEHAHEHRLVHRDMKPSNLILSRQGVVKIVDFGLARVNEEQLSRGLTDTGTTMGTLDFIAPEQCEDATHADIRADIYSLGCTLFNLLTGHAPFSGPTYSTAAAKVRAHCVAPPPSTSQVRPEVSAKLSGIVARMMAKQPTKRFSTPGEVAEALAPFAITSDLAKIASSAPIERGNRADTDVLLTSTPQANRVDAETKPIVKVNGRGRKIGKPLLVGSGLLVGLIILAAVLFTLRTKDGNLVVEISQPDAVVQISNEEGKVEITRPGEQGTVSIAVDPGKHRLQVAKDGFQIFAQDFVMETGGNASIAAKLIPLEGHPPVAKTGKPLAFETPGFEPWAREVAVLPAEAQVEAVVKKLQELNPGFDGKQTHRIEHGAVTELQFLTDRVIDISPARALAGLKFLASHGSDLGKGKLANLSPLVGLKLTKLDCGGTQVSDLSPLKNMKLATLYCDLTQVSDLSPLQGLPLTSLHCGGTSIANLAPLQGMPLTELWCGGTLVADLSPLEGMPLAALACDHTPISDLSKLQGLNLTYLVLTPASITTGMEIVRQIKSLKTISIDGKKETEWPAAEFWAKYDSGEFGKAPASRPPAPPASLVAETWKPGPEDDILPGIALRPAKLAGVARWNVETAERRIAASRMAVSPDGKHVACNGGIVRIFSIPKGDLENELPIERATAMAWSLDGSRLATGRESDGSLRIFDPISCKQMVVIQAAARAARELCWSRDGQWLAWGNSWNSIELVEYGLPICRSDGKPSPKIPNPETVRSVAFCPGADLLATAGSAGFIRIWDGAFRLYREIPKQPSVVNSLSWQPEGKWIVAGYDDGHLRAWSIEDGKKIADVPAGLSFINQIDVSKDGRWVAVACQDCHLGVFSTVDWSNRFPEDPFYFGGDSLWQVKWLADGSAIVFLGGKGNVRLATVSGTPSTHELSKPSPRIRPGGVPLVVTHDGTAFASVDSDGVRIRRTADSALQQFIPNGSDEICAASWNRDGSRLATGACHGAVVRIWDAPSGRQVGSRHFSEPVVDVKVDWSADGLGIVAAGRQDNQVICRVWDADKEDGGRHVFAGDQSNEYFTVVWSPDGKLLALRAGDKIHVARTDDWAEFWVSDLIASHNELTWSPDSRQILANSKSYPARGELQIFELKESKPVHVIPEPFFWQAAWNLAQDRLAIAEPREGNLKILNAADFSPVREIKSRAGWLAWLPHQPRLLSGDSGESLTVLWNTDDGQPEWCSTLLLDNKVAVFNGAGQLLPSSSPGVEGQLRYLVERDDKTIETLSFLDFNRRFTGAKLAVPGSK